MAVVNAFAQRHVLVRAGRLIGVEAPIRACDEKLHAAFGAELSETICGHIGDTADEPLAHLVHRSMQPD